MKIEQEIDKNYSFVFKKEELDNKLKEKFLELNNKTIINITDPQEGMLMRIDFLDDFNHLSKTNNSWNIKPSNIQHAYIEYEEFLKTTEIKGIINWTYNCTKKNRILLHPHSFSRSMGT